MPWSNVNTPFGPLIGYKINLSTATGGKQWQQWHPGWQQQHKYSADQNTIANNALQDHNRQPENTMGNNASQDHNNSTANTEEATTTISKSMVGYLVVPYTKGLSESFKNICGKYEIQTYFKGKPQSSKHSWDPMTKTPRTVEVG